MLPKEKGGIKKVFEEIITDWSTKRRLRGASAPRPRQGQKPGGPHVRRAVAKRSYPTSEDRGNCRECQAVIAQEWPRGATLHLRSGATAGRSYPTSEVGADGPEELPRFQGQGRRPGRATKHPRSGGCAGTGGPRGAIQR